MSSNGNSSATTTTTSSSSASSSITATANNTTTTTTTTVTTSSTTSTTTTPACASPTIVPLSLISQLNRTNSSTSAPQEDLTCALSINSTLTTFRDNQHCGLSALAKPLNTSNFQCAITNSGNNLLSYSNVTSQFMSANGLVSFPNGYYSFPNTPSDQTLQDIMKTYTNMCTRPQCYTLLESDDSVVWNTSSCAKNFNDYSISWARMSQSLADAEYFPICEPVISKTDDKCPARTLILLNQLAQLNVSDPMFNGTAAMLACGSSSNKQQSLWTNCYSSALVNTELDAVLGFLRLGFLDENITFPFLYNSAAQQPYFPNANISTSNVPWINVSTINMMYAACNGAAGASSSVPHMWMTFLIMFIVSTWMH